MACGVLSAPRRWGRPPGSRVAGRAPRSPPFGRVPALADRAVRFFATAFIFTGLSGGAPRPRSARGVLPDALRILTAPADLAVGRRVEDSTDLLDEIFRQA